MALQEQHVAFKFAGGIETKMDSKAVPPVRLLTLENGVFHRASSIKKRNGYSLTSRAIDGSVSLIEGARRLASRDDELLLFTLTECYSKQSGADQWTDAGALIAPTGYDRAAVHTGTAQTMPDRATSNGVAAYAWEDSLGGVWWTVTDATNDSVYRVPTQANASGERPRCVAAGESLLIFYAVPTQRQICCIVVNTSTPTAAVSETIVATDLDTTNPEYDAVPTTRDGTPALLTWHEFGTTNIRVSYVTAAGVLGSPGLGYPSAGRISSYLLAASPIACAYYYSDGANADRILVSAVADHDNNGVYNGFVFNLNAGTTAIPIASTVSESDVAYTAPVDVDRIALTVADGSAWAVFEEYAAATSNHFCVVNSVVIGGAAGTATTIRSLCLAAGAFTIEDDAFAVFVHDTTYFNTYLTLRLSDFAPAGRHLPGSACGPTQPHLPSVYVDDNIATLTVPYKTRLASENNDKFGESGLRTITMDFESEDTHQTVQFGRGIYLAAACPQHYAGRKWTEQGFHVGPELIAAPTQGTAGSLTQTSTYLYKFWYEWTDDLGEIHRGPESVGTSVTLTGANDDLTFAIPTLRVTRKSNVRICVARSLPGDTSTLYRVSSLDPTTSGAVNGYITNSTTVDTVTWVDRMSDANAALEEQIYTVGGILSNDPVPLGSHVATGKNRLFFTDAQAGNVVRFSKRIATGFGAELAPELMHDVDPLGGSITALATMDDVVFVFKAGAIFAFNGDGPFENGESSSGGIVGGFSATQLITSDVGCSDPSSIVLTPLGLMFKSTKGIRLLTRAREVMPVGDPVESYNSQVVRRATVMPDRTAVLFLTDDGSSLYFDYQFGQWSTFTNHEGLDAVVVNNTYHYLRTNDIVYQETPGEHADGSARITMRLETAWLHMLEHLQGFQRFWKLLLLGTWSSAHQLAVSHRMSYDEAWSEPYYLDATGEESDTGWITGDSANPIGEDPITGTVYGEGDYGEGPYGGEGPDVYQWRYGIHEAGQAVQFRFEDFEKAGLAGASFELTEMTIVGGVMKPDIRPFSGARST
jgi:hypothetical protein